MSSSIPSWQIFTAHAQQFRGARDLAFCLKVPLDSLLVWASSEASGETARMRRLAWTFAARTGDKYQIRLTRSIYKTNPLPSRSSPMTFMKSSKTLMLTTQGAFYHSLIFAFLHFTNNSVNQIIGFSLEILIVQLRVYQATRTQISLKWAASWQNQQCGCAPSEDSDQPGCPPSLIKVFPVRSMGS